MKLGPININGSAVATSVIAAVLAALILRAIQRKAEGNG